MIRICSFFVIHDLFIFLKLSIVDVNEDGVISVQDIVVLQKWIHKAQNTTLADRTVADLNSDNVVDAFDLALLK